MAGFKTHVTVSSLLGCGYAGAGYAYGMPPATAIVGGALCGFAGMLPDLDSDYGVPLRETMAFAAATIPMLLVERFASLGFGHDEMVLLGVSLYLFVRFGVTNMIRKYTVHRGMFHSIPAGLVFAGVAFLIAGGTSVEVRYYKAGGVLAGFMSHLLLDEIYSIEWKSGRYRFKKSFGTAFKLWGDDAWANLSTYGKLAIVVVLILGEPAVMQRIEQRNPEFARKYNELYGRFEGISSLTNQATDAAREWTDSFRRAETPPPEQTGPYEPRSYQAATPPEENPGFHDAPSPGFGPPPPTNQSDSFFAPPGQPGEAVIRREYDPTDRPY